MPSTGLGCICVPGVISLLTSSVYPCRYAVHTATGAPVSLKFYSKMEDFKREREVFSLGLDNRHVPAMLASEVGV